MNDSQSMDVLGEGKRLRLVRRGKWEYVQRVNASGVVIVAALTPEWNVLFVEQHRAPVDARVVELPAGLAGDIAGKPQEALEDAARRELLEETGYEAKTISRVMTCPSSAGQSDELVTFFVAQDLKKIATGGGEGSEDITVHETPLDEIDSWLAARSAAGCLIGARVLTGIYLLKRELREQG